MSAKPPVTVPVEEFLLRFSPSVRQIVDVLRILIRACIPEAEERVYPVWQGIGYTHPRAGYLCAIFPQQGFVKVGFEFGALLADPDGLLTGEGKQLRYLPIHTVEAIPAEALRQFIQAAIDLPASRSAKLEMIRNRSQKDEPQS